MLYQLSYPPETVRKSGLPKIPKRSGRVNAIRTRGRDTPVGNPFGDAIAGAPAAARSGMMAP